MVVAALVTASLAFAVPARSQARQSPDPTTLAPDRPASFDGRERLGERATTARVARARAAFARSLGRQGVLLSDPVTGTIRMLGRLDGYLTEPSRATPKAVAMSYVASNLDVLGLSRRDLRTFRPAGNYVDILGTHHLSWVQRAHGLTAFMNGLEANVTSDGRLINVTGSPVHRLSAPSYLASVNASSAIASARRSVGASRVTAETGDTAKLVLFETGAGTRLAWETVTRVSFDETDLSIVDAATGRVLWRSNMTRSIEQGAGLAWQFYPSDLVPIGGGTQQIVAFPVFDSAALSGPNAHAYFDTSDDDKAQAADEIPAPAGTNWSFPAVLDTTTSTQNCSPDRACTWDATTPFSWQQNAAQTATQVYYFLNQYHDHLAADPIGFTEAAGNFQVTNVSGQGKGHDPVLGEVLDGAALRNGFPDGPHLDNSNMTEVPDGVPATMQTYLFAAVPGLPGVPSTSGGEDADVVYHEYTHGMDGRLVTYPDGTPALNAYQSGSMDEALADWYASDYLNNLGLKPDAPAISDVVMGLYGFGGELRTQPLDCPVGVDDPACPGTGLAGPGGYTYADFHNIVPFLDPHTDGEIWSETLWQIRQQLGATTAETDLTRALELSPQDPSFLDMRNAILQADEVAFGGANQDALWAVFANRGMGFFASTTDGEDLRPIADDSLPPDCSTQPCGSITGRVVDSITGKPVGNVRVGIEGHDSGFAADLADTTNGAGRFSIKNVPFHSYRGVSVDGRGYEPRTKRNVKVAGTTTLSVRLNRDWASLDAGARITGFSPPDYTRFGCGPGQAFDMSLLNGWDSKLPGPRFVTVRLPKAIEVKSFGFAPGAFCGDDRGAAVERFEIYTKTSTGSWKLAFHGGLLPVGRLSTLIPAAGSTNDVRYVRLVLLTARNNKRFVDVAELSVRGA